MSIWGIGKKMFLAILAYTVPAVAATLHWPHVFQTMGLPRVVGGTIGAVLLVCGGGILITAGRAIIPAFQRGRLLTTGIYGVVRNPPYCG